MRVELNPLGSVTTQRAAVGMGWERGSRERGYIYIHILIANSRCCMAETMQRCKTTVLQEK